MSDFSKTFTQYSWNPVLRKVWKLLNIGSYCPLLKVSTENALLQFAFVQWLEDSVKSVLVFI